MTKDMDNENSLQSGAQNSLHLIHSIGVVACSTYTHYVAPQCGVPHIGSTFSWQVHRIASPCIHTLLFLCTEDQGSWEDFGQLQLRCGQAWCDYDRFEPNKEGAVTFSCSDLRGFTNWTDRVWGFHVCLLSLSFWSWITEARHECSQCCRAAQLRS